MGVDSVTARGLHVGNSLDFCWRSLWLQWLSVELLACVSEVEAASLGCCWLLVATDTVLLQLSADVAFI